MVDFSASDYQIPPTLCPCLSPPFLPHSFIHHTTYARRTLPPSIDAIRREIEGVLSEGACRVIRSSNLGSDLTQNNRNYRAQHFAEQSQVPAENCTHLAMQTSRRVSVNGGQKEEDDATSPPAAWSSSANSTLLPCTRHVLLSFMTCSFQVNCNCMNSCSLSYSVGTWHASSSEGSAPNQHEHPISYIKGSPETFIRLESSSFSNQSCLLICYSTSTPIPTELPSINQSIPSG